MEKTLITNLVFIDASYLRAIGFDVLSSTMTKFKELCKSGELTLLTTNITEKENENNIKTYAEELNYDIRPTLKVAVAALISKEVDQEDVVDCLQVTLNRWDRMCQKNRIV